MPKASNRFRDSAVFGSMRAAAAKRRKYGSSRRVTSKLPTSLEEARGMLEGMDSTLKFLEGVKSELERGEDKEHE